MDKETAIKTATNAQLQDDEKPLPGTGQEVMQTNYHYNQTTLSNFFNGVKCKLSKMTPPYAFDTSQVDVQQCLLLSINQVRDQINGATT